MKFYLGTHMENWLEQTRVPLFINRRRFERRKSLPRAVGRWALDSGGFTELSTFGRWTINAREYVALVQRYRDEIGGMDWAAPQDWMCEPVIIDGGVVQGMTFPGTHLSIAEHQRLTTENFIELRTLDSALPFVPVLQGWERDDYMRHIEQYAAAGIDLEALPLVGLGSVCRRQHTGMVEGLIEDLQPLKLHGFGFKLQGLSKVADLLTSADSLSWSYAARKQKPLEGCSHRSCANCLKFALQWHGHVLQVIDRCCDEPRQPTLADLWH
jgi:hypothetical protein